MGDDTFLIDSAMREMNTMCPAWVPVIILA